MMMMLINSRADAPRIHDSILYPGKTRPCHDCCRQLQIFPDWMNGSEVTSRHRHSHLLPEAPRLSPLRQPESLTQICLSFSWLVKNVRRSLLFFTKYWFHILSVSVVLHPPAWWIWLCRILNCSVPASLGKLDSYLSAGELKIFSEWVGFGLNYSFYWQDRNKALPSSARYNPQFSLSQNLSQVPLLRK